MLSKASHLVCWFSVCVIMIGCKGSDAPAVAPVSGRVMYKDKPVVGAHVNFSPENGGRIASGITDSSGQYTLSTYATNDGAILGKHRISVIAHGPDRALRPGEIGSGMPGEKVPGDPIIPRKYFTPESSGLTHEVVRGSNDVPLVLTD